jgi:IrrE N-terminal-like domain
LKPIGDGQSQGAQEGRDAHVRQLFKLALDSPTPDDLTEFLKFSTKFRRLSVWNARMAHIQRPGARIIASEFEWHTVGRYVQPDAVPIIILWPFSPIRFVYELADTGPTIDRESINDPFAVKGHFRAGMLATLVSSLKKQKRFRITIEARRHGFSYAGSAAAQGLLPITPSLATPLGDGALISNFVSENASSDSQESKRGIPAFRVTVNDRLQPSERFVTLAHELAHIFCGHLGECKSQGGNEEESGWPDRRALGKNEKELEAEAVAYLVASRAELVTGSATYLKPYAQRADMKSVDVDLIIRAAARIERMAKIHYGSMAFRPEKQRRTISASPSPPRTAPPHFPS